jgi:hypothetical protein
MVASLFAFAFRPETPAFSDEEMLMLGPCLRNRSDCVRPASFGPAA